MKPGFDELNEKILKILSAEGRLPNTDLAKKIGVAPSAALNRVRKLEEGKVILSYHAKLDCQAIGYDFLTFVLIRTNGQSSVKKIGDSLSEIPEVIEIHQTAGDHCFLLKIRTGSTKEFAELLNEKIAPIKGISGTTTIISLSTFKEEMNPL